MNYKGIGKVSSDYVKVAGLVYMLQPLKSVLGIIGTWEKGTDIYWG